MQMISTMLPNAQSGLILLAVILEKIHQINVVETIQQDFRSCPKMEFINVAEVKFSTQNTQSSFLTFLQSLL